MFLLLAYSAEAFPLHLRDVGMSFATATCWGFNFILSLTWPALVKAFTPQGAFGWYAAWNMFGWVYCYFLLPETKNLTLEELDTVFGEFTYPPIYISCKHILTVLSISEIASLLHTTAENCHGTCRNIFSDEMLHPWSHWCSSTIKTHRTTSMATRLLTLCMRQRVKISPRRTPRKVLD
jgi:hypothetical protein